MAQQDTGLGWSAKEEWLIQAGNLQVAAISELVGAVVLPTAISPVELVANGLRTQVEEVPGSYTAYWIVGTEPDTEVICFFRGTSPSYTLCFVGPQNAKVYYCSYDPQSQSTSSYGTAILNTPLDSFPGFYWNSGPGGYVGTYVTLNPDIPIYTSFSDAAQHISRIETPFYKSNAGYAVGCFAKWKTGSSTLQSPILISSNSNYVNMSCASTEYNFAKASFLWQGMRFYMGFWDIPISEGITSGLVLLDRSYSDAPTFTLEELFRYIAKDVYSNIVVINAPDPYQEGEGSREAGGDGSDDESDEIPFTDAPVSGIAYSGFLTIFTPNLSQLQNLANYMWSDFFDVDTWKKLFANPMDAILGLHIIPCSPGYSGNKEVKVGGMGTGVSMDYTTIRYHEVSMGTCTVPKKWGSYLDYNPYTKVSIFLPYIGFRDLDTDDVMDRTLALQYIVDILTGACVAELRCGADVLYSWEGNCANPVPITSNSWSSAIGSAVSIAAAIATTALTHGASAPMIAGTVASVGANSMNLKPSVSRSGSLGGSGGFIAKQTPYIIRTVPNLVIPADQNKFIGYPSFVTTSLGSLTGYNEISSIHLEGIPATGNELTEIETLLKGGVIF